MNWLFFPPVVLTSRSIITTGGGERKTSDSICRRPLEIIGTAGAGAGSFTKSFAFPNPPVGNKKPTLHFELDGAVDEVKIKIYDVAGTLADQKILDGSGAIITGGGTAAYEYTWDNSSAASGVYLYVIEAKKGGARVTRTGKLAIVR